MLSFPELYENLMELKKAIGCDEIHISIAQPDVGRPRFKVEAISFVSGKSHTRSRMYTALELQQATHPCIFHEHFIAETPGTEPVG